MRRRFVHLFIILRCGTDATVNPHKRRKIYGNAVPNCSENTPMRQKLLALLIGAVCLLPAQASGNDAHTPIEDGAMIHHSVKGKQQALANKFAAAIKSRGHKCDSIFLISPDGPANSYLVSCNKNVDHFFLRLKNGIWDAAKIKM